MHKKRFDIARALRDRAYRHSLSEEEQALVSAANPIGEVDLRREQLESVSGGLSGGDHIESTTTTTNQKSCQCSDSVGQIATQSMRGVTVTERAHFTPECACVC